MLGAIFLGLYRKRATHRTSHARLRSYVILGVNFGNETNEA
jgi:hypothetical protein